MKWVYNDGGRAAAGFKGTTGDCAARAIAIATGKPYQEVYDAINEIGSSERTGRRKRKKSNARTGVYTVAAKKYMAALGWAWVPTMAIGSGCKVHLNENELPGGRIVCRVSKHYVAVIDGVLHDIFDSGERGTTVYSKNTPKEDLPKGAYWLENGNGWAYSPERCVYGYWSKA